MRPARNCPRFFPLLFGCQHRVRSSLEVRIILGPEFLGWDVAEVECRRLALHQSTHSDVTHSTSSSCRNGPLRWDTSWSARRRSAVAFGRLYMPSSRLPKVDSSASMTTGRRGLGCWAGRASAHGALARRPTRPALARPGRSTQPRDLWPAARRRMRRSTALGPDFPAKEAVASRRIASASCSSRYYRSMRRSRSAVTSPGVV